MLNKLNTISSKIIISVISILIVFITLANIFVFTFFKHILIEETVSLYKKDLEKKIEMINSVVREINTLAQGIVVDDNLQKFCYLEESEIGYLEIKKVTDEINKLILPQSYVIGCTIKTENQFYYTKFPFDESLKNMDENNGLEWNGNISEPYTMKVAENQVRVINYKIDIKSVNGPYKKIGELTLLIKVDYIENLIKGEDLAGYLLSNGQSTTYCSGGNIDLVKLLEDVDIEQEMKISKSGHIKTNKGFLIWNGSYNNDFYLYGLLTDKDINTNYSGFIIFFVTFTVITLLIIVWILIECILKLMKPVKILSEGMNKFAKGKMNTKVNINTEDEFELLSDSFNRMVDSINNYIEEKIKNEKINKKIKFDLLMSKIHPHFLYNTLNSITFLAIKEGNDDIANMVRSLIKILQDGMMVHDDKVIDTLKKELEVIEAYCLIQRYKYNDKFKIEYNIDKQSECVIIPKNILQPIIENSIFHGIVAINRNGTIKVEAFIKDEYLNIQIANDGAKVSEELLHNINVGKVKETKRGTLHSIGLSSIIERLEYMYKDDYKFEMQNLDKEGCITKIKVPINTFTNIQSMEELSEK